MTMHRAFPVIVSSADVRIDVGDRGVLGVVEVQDRERPRPSTDNFAASTTRGITLIAPVIAKTGRNANKGTFTPLRSTEPSWERSG